MKRESKQVPITAVWKVLQSMAQNPAIQKVAGFVLGWFGKKITQSIIDHKVSNNNSPLKNNIMEKGMLTKASWDAFMALIANAVKDQPPTVKLLISIGGKLLGMVGDDILAEKLPEELKVRSRAFFDMILVTKDYDAAIPLGIDLLTEIYELLKKPEVVAIPAKK